MSRGKVKAGERDDNIGEGDVIFPSALPVSVHH